MHLPRYASLIIIFSSIGVLDTLYLSYHAITKTPVACWFFPDAWCRAVQFSKQSKIVGIPNAFLGLGMNVAILLLLAGYLKEMFPFWPVQAVVMIGFLFSCYFIYIQAAVLKAFCTWCVLSAFNFFILFGSVYFWR
ncbi:MAG: hypothetical protein KGI50_04885 [Patescibacteria group bacterium]|nr:hypothetical protein [Patescibacteria group bacterium]MDE2438626.1 hypothetical protein [Patescibacteria group bacterium]